MGKVRFHSFLITLLIGSIFPALSAGPDVTPEEVAQGVIDDFLAERYAEIFDSLTSDSPFRIDYNALIERKREIKKELRKYVEPVKLGYTEVNGQRVLLPEYQEAFKKKQENERLIEKAREKLERETPKKKHDRNSYAGFMREWCTLTPQPCTMIRMCRSAV